MSELLPFPFRLRRSARSRTVQALYSANIAELLGTQRGHQEIYIHPREVLKTVLDRVRQHRYPDPGAIDMMLLDRAPPVGWDIIVELRLGDKQPESKHRYEVIDPYAPLSGSVYFPVGMFRGAPPETCFLALRWAELRAADGSLVVDGAAGSPTTTS